MAQSFTIRRPTEGSKVREVVAIRIPKGSIPEGSYIGIIVNGKFLEAVLPPVEDEDYVYSLDTKANRIPDGDLDLEAVLYMDFNNRAEIVNRTSVRVKLDNYTSIKIPDDGVRLRYKFKPGQEFVYRNSITMSAGTISQAQQALGSRIGELPVATEELRLLYGVENIYPSEDGNDALIRMQPMPTKGKNYAMLTTIGDAGAKKFWDFEMASTYMRITATGREVWGTAAPYFPMGGTSGQAATTDLFALIPLPVLPSKSLYPGDTWQAQHLLSSLDLDTIYGAEKLTTPLASRGTFIGVEWERGIPCAKFSVAVDAGPREIANAANLNNQPGAAQKVSLNGTVWFSLDKGIIVKSDLVILQESAIEVAGPAPATGAGGGGGNAPGAAPGRRTKGLPGGVGSIRPGDFVFKPHVDEAGQFWFLQDRTGGAGVDFSEDGGGGNRRSNQNVGFGTRSGGGSGETTKQILRVRLRLLTELEI